MVMETSRISHSEAVLSLGELPSRQHLTEDNVSYKTVKRKDERSLGISAFAMCAKAQLK